MSGLPALRSLARLFLPLQCPGCHRRVPDPELCASCRQEIGRVGAARATGFAGEVERFPAITLGVYSGAWKQVVLSYKKDPVAAAAGVVERRLHAGLEPWLARAERTIVPVPMAPVRRREKGFNPPERLARSLADATGWRVAPRLLRRDRYDGPLTGSGRLERRRRLAGAIGVDPREWRRTGRRTGAGGAGDAPGRVLLIDDVLTTGSTLEASVQALRKVGTRDVLAVTLARAGRDVQE